MNANGHVPASAGDFDAGCAATAAVLPVLDEPHIDPDAAAHARAHLAHCARCQAQAAAYSRLETVLRAAVGPASVTPRRTADVVADFLRGLPAPVDAEDAEHTSVATQAASHTAPVGLRPTASRPSGRSFWSVSGMVSLAAILIVSLLTAALLASHQRQRAPANPPPVLAPVVGSDTELASLSMDSPADGWAVGLARPANDTNGSATRVLLMHYTRGAWTRVDVPILGMLRSVSMISATDGWAVGDVGLMLHYDGATWTRVPAPEQLQFSQVRMLSPTDGFAIGDSGILHFDGRQWAMQSLPESLGAGTRNGVSLAGIAIVAPDDAWAVGSLVPFEQPSSGAAPTGVVNYYPTTPPSALILHYTGVRWTVAQVLPGASLANIAMTSATDGWAAGNTDTFTYQPCGPYTPPCTQAPNAVETIYPLLLRFSAGRWAAVPNQVAGQPTQSESLGAIAMVSASDGWMVRGSENSMLLHYDGSTWNEVNMPSFQATVEIAYMDIAMTSATSGWAVGYRFSDRAHGIPNSSGYGYQPTVTPIILHFDHGEWSVVAS